MGAYLQDFIGKLKNTMMQSKAKNLSYCMSDIDAQSHDISEAFSHVRYQVTLCAIDLFSHLFLASEQELKVKYGAAMQVQIERVYGLQVSAKYVALSGIKNLIYLLWMTVRILSPRSKV